jgi:hypothetical protein
VSQYSGGYLAALAQCSESLEQMPPAATLDEVKELVASIRDGEIIIPDHSLDS